MDAAGLHGRTITASGAVTEYDFDAAQTFPVRIQDAAGNTTTAEHDYRVSRVAKLTDIGGSVYQASYDPLARPRAVVEPGDSPALPSHSWDYSTALPVEAKLQQRAVSGAAPVLDTREIFDGYGKLIERRQVDDGGELIVASSLLRCPRLPHARLPGASPRRRGYAMPDDSRSHVEYEYDAVGRPLRQTNVDGSTHSHVYGALTMDESDEEDNRAGPGAVHASTPTARHLFASGHVRAIEETLSGRTSPARTPTTSRAT